MTEHQEHFGKKFYQDKHTGYWISTTSPRIRAHVWVWNHYHGKVEKGFHIHHKDENKSNNSIENLDIVSPSKHLKIHFDLDPSKRELHKGLLDKIRPLTKEWHASEEGRTWHKLHGIIGWKNRKPIEITCELCGTKALTKTYHQTFCSNACKSKARRASGVDDIDKTCPHCNKIFRSSKYQKTIYCSRGCAVTHLNKKD